MNPGRGERAVLAAMLAGMFAAEACALTVSTWTGGSGDYTDAVNWDTNPVVPNNGVDNFTAAIDGNLVVTLDGVAAITVDALELGERTRFIVDGPLASFVTAGGTFDSGAQVFARAAGMIDLGTTSIDAVSLTADDIGGVANARLTSAAVSYTGSTGFNQDRDLAADGDGTRVELASVVTIVRNSGNANNLNIRGRDGGTVDLSALTSIVAPAAGLAGSTLLFEAASGGTIVLPGLTDFDEMDYEATGGGNITGEVHSVTNGRLTIGGSSDALTDLSNLTSVENTIVTAEDGAVIDLGSANIDRASLIATKQSGSAAPGATITSSATSYTGTEGFNLDRNLKADGTGTLLDLGALTTLVRNRGKFNNLEIRAVDGGSVDMSALGTFTDAPGGNDGSTILVHAAAGGTVILDGISDFDDVRYEAIGGGNITGRIDTLINGVLTIGGTSDALTDLGTLISVMNSTVSARDGAGVSLGAANIDAASLIAQKESNGAAPGATLVTAALAYTGTDGFNLDRTLMADGTGTQLDLSSLATLVRNRGGSNNLDIVAKNGGTVDLSGLSLFTDAPGGNGGAVLTVNAQAGSTIALAGIADFNDVRYEATGGGDITGQIQTFTNGRLTIGGASDVTTDLAALTSVTDSIVTAEDGAAVALGAANIDRASLIARTGNGGAPNASLNTGATSYTGTDGFNLDREWKADGAGTLLDLGSLTTLVRNRGTLNNLHIRAFDGGRVDLSGLSGFTDAAGGNDGGAVDLVAENGGEIVLDGVASLDDVDFVARDGGRITGQLVSFLNASMTIGGSSDAEIDLSALATVAGSKITAEDGAELDLGATTIDQASLVARVSDIGGTAGARLSSIVTTYTGTDGFDNDREFRADGAGTTIDLSALTNLVRNRGTLNELSVRAFDGGVVDLSNLAALTDPAAGLDGGRVFVEADGADSEARLGALGALDHAEVVIDNGASVDFGALGYFAHGIIQMDPSAGARDLQVADAFVLGVDGVIDLSESAAAFIVGSAGGTIAPGAVNVAGGSFGGNGTVIGDVVNAGELSPGESSGTLAIDGDYVQQADGLLSIEIESETVFDVLSVSGQATLAGTLDVTFLSGFDPGTSVFIILTAGTGIDGEFDNVLFNGAVVDIFYGDDFVQLNMGPVPLPAALWLFGPALFGLVVRRRRSVSCCVNG